MRTWLLLCLLLLVPAAALRAQVESPVLVFNRGMLWHSVFFAKIGPNFSNWARRGIGLDWPGFDETWIREDVGGAASHLVTGGFYIGARKTRDTVLTVVDWSMYGTTVSSDPGSKYRVTRHRQRFQRGENTGWPKSLKDLDLRTTGPSSEHAGSLPAEEDVEEVGGVEFRGSLADLYLANLHLRTASRVLLHLGSFYADTFSDLGRRAKRLSWEAYMRPGRPVALRVTCHV